MQIGRAAKTGIAVALVLALVYGGLKGYVFLQTRNALKQLIAVASPYAFVEYGGIGSTLYQGAVHVTNVHVTPRGYSDGVTVARVTLDPGGLWQLLSLSRRLDARDYPASLGITTKGVTIALDGDLVRDIEKRASARAPGGGAVGMQHCGGLSTLGPQHLRKLGYQVLVSDTQLRYHYDRRTSQLKLDLDGTTHDLSSATLSVTVKGPIAIPHAGTVRAFPRISELTIDYKDGGYTERLKRYCAQASGTTVEDFIKAEVGQSDDSFANQWGVVPGPGLREAYRNFLEKPGEIYLRIMPSADAYSANLKLQKIDDLFASLNPTVKVNGERVDDLSFRIPGLTRLAAAKSSESSATDSAPAVANGASHAGPRPRARRAYEDVPTATTDDMQYHAVAVAELGKSVGEYVRLTVKGNRVREGTLTRALNQVAYVEVNLAPGSTVVVQIPFERIQSAEVLR